MSHAPAHPVGNPGPIIIAFLVAAAIFGATHAGLDLAGVSGLYLLVVLIASQSGSRRTVAAAAAGCLVLIAIDLALRGTAGRTPAELLPALAAAVAIVIAAAILGRGLTTDFLAAGEARHLDESHDSITVRDLVGTITYWNKASTLIYGWARGEAVGGNFGELLQTRADIPAPAILAHLFTHGAWEGEVVNRTKDGRSIEVESRLTLVRDRHGRPAAILETANDITERKRSDQELRVSETRYRGMFQTMGVAYWEMDFSLVRARCNELWAEGVRDFAAYLRENPGFVRDAIELSRPLNVNAASVRLFGADSPEELMENYGRCWPVEGEPVYAGAMLAALRNAPTFESEAVLRGLDGRRLEVLFTVSYPPGSETRDSIVVALVDLAESNRAKAELHAAQESLAHAMRLTSLGVLTATIAHEVNQPLGGVIANGRAAQRWLARDPPALDEVASSIEQTLAEAKRAASVLSGIRAMARKKEPDPEPFELNVLLEETMALLGRELRQTDVDLHMVLERSSPLVLADRIQLQQVVINLALNSVHALKEVEDRPRTLSLKSWSADGKAYVSVDDSGPGIEPQLADQLFTPFFTTKDQGLGVGLSVCGNIIERHGGSISVSPKTTPGFCVEFSLPLAER